MRRSECKVFLERTFGLQKCLGIVLQGAGHCKSVRTVLLKRCTYGMLISFGIVLSVRTHGKVNSCNDIHRTYSMLMLWHCQSAARHILIASYGRHRPRVPGP